MVLVAAAIGLIVRSKDAPFAPQATVSIPIAVAKVTSLDALSLHTEEPLFSLDVVTINGKPVAASPVKEIAVEPMAAIRVAGWAADRIAGVPANGVFAAVGSEKPVALQYGGARPDVATALGNRSLENTGFDGILPKGLPPGVVPLRFFVVNGNGSSYDEVPSPISLTVK